MARSGPVREELGRDLRGAAAEYATLADATTRTSQRARVLHLVEEIRLPRAELAVRSVSESELRADPGVRGAILVHLDLVFRASVSSFELAFTATRGLVLVASHPGLDSFPVGVALALPASGLPSRRRELFDERGPLVSEAEVIVLYALATNPGRLGAGAALVGATRDESSHGHAPQLVAFSPLTGLRARLIHLVDDADAWRPYAIRPDAALLREQLLAVLGETTLPHFLPEPARGFIAGLARDFATSPAYRIGTFHTKLGAQLVGVADAADEGDADALWARAYFDYGAAT